MAFGYDVGKISAGCPVSYKFYNSDNLRYIYMALLSHFVYLKNIAVNNQKVSVMLDGDAVKCVHCAADEWRQCMSPMCITVH